jgi:hypothetical protein
VEREVAVSPPVESPKENLKLGSYAITILVVFKAGVFARLSRRREISLRQRFLGRT